MSIIPDTLKKTRESRGFSQAELAKKSNVSKRQIARIESGDTSPDRVRKHTQDCLAKALRVKPEELSKTLSPDWTDDDWKSRGYTPIKFFFDSEVRLNYRWVMHHYGVGLDDLVDAAPWMFALLAEMSLSERRRRITEADQAFDTAMGHLASHLGHSALAEQRFEEMKSDEEASLASRDVFGKEVLEREQRSGGDGPLPFDPDKTNPFADFLRDVARSVGSKEIDADDLDSFLGDMPKWPVFQRWLDDLTGGDGWARFAVESLNVLSKIPDDLKGEERVADRIEWLTSKIPAEMREREEKRRAELSEIGL